VIHEGDFLLTLTSAERIEFYSITSKKFLKEPNFQLTDDIFDSFVLDFRNNIWIAGGHSLVSLNEDLVLSKVFNLKKNSAFFNTMNKRRDLFSPLRLSQDNNLLAWMKSNSELVIIDTLDHQILYVEEKYLDICKSHSKCS